jgi:Prokaryotic E2 family E
MAREDFAKELRQMGYDVTEHSDGCVSFPYTIEIGKFAGQEIRLGFVVPPDFPLSPPTGPHVKPRLLPINTAQGPHPAHGVHESQNKQFDGEWQYWSRPMPHWQKTQRKVADVMRHIRRLFEKQ